MRNVRSALGLGALAIIVGVAGCSTSTLEQSNEEPKQGTSQPSERAPQLDPAVADSAQASPVRVGWDEDSSVLFIREGVLHAWLYNERSEPRTAHLYVTSKLDGERSIIGLGPVTLQGHERRVVDVPIASLPVQNVTTPAAVTLVVDAEEDGREKRFPSESLYVAFAADYAKVFASHVDPLGPLVAAAADGNPSDARVADLLAGKHVSPKDAAALVERLGKPAGRIRDAKGAFKPIATNTSASLASTGFTAGLGHDVDASHVMQPDPWPTYYPAKICANYDVTYTDSHLGEDYLADGFWKWVIVEPIGIIKKYWDPSPIPARFSKITFSKNGSVVSTKQLDATGCVNVNLTTGNYTVTVSTWVTNGTTTFDVEKTFQNPVDWTCGMQGAVSSNGVGGYNFCKKNDSFTGTFTMPAGSFNKTFGSDDATPAFRVAAVAGHILSLADHGLKPETYVAFSNSGCEDFSWQEACAQGGVAYYGNSIGLGNKDTTLSKVIIAHEMGHAFEQHAYGNFDHTYTIDASAPASCKCDHVVSANKIHCLQSRHTFTAAHTEGFAQFIAQHTLNKTTESDCTFAYYKEVKPDVGAVKSPPVVVDCAAPPKWMETHCVKANSSVEWDQMSFLRGATSGTDALTMTEVFGVYAQARSQVYYLTWSALQTAALTYFGNNAAHPKYVKFLAAASAAGVQH
jgi:hypothetical protein